MNWKEINGMGTGRAMDNEIHTNPVFSRRIGINVIDDEDNEFEFSSRFNAVQKIFNDWTIRSGMPGGANGGLLFVCFLKYVSEFSKELGIEVSKIYSYEVICRLFPDQLGMDEIEEYVSDIERQLGIGGHLLRNFVRDINPQLVTDALRESINCLEGIPIKGKEGAFLDALINQIVYGADFRKEAMCVSTVEQSKWMSALLGLREGETLGDFCAGIGVTSVVASARLKVSVYNQEIQPTLAAMNQMLMIMSGCQDCKVVCGDSLNLGPELHEKFDKIICDLPTMHKSDDRLSLKYGMPTDGTWGLIYQIIDSLKVGGRAVIWLAQGYGFRGGVAARHRGWLVKGGYLEAVINPMPDLVPFTRARYNIWVLTKPQEKEKPHDVYMADISEEDSIFHPESWDQDDCETLLRILIETKFQDDTVTRMVPVNEIEENGWHLGPQRYLNQMTDLEKFLMDSATLYEQEESLETEISDLSQRIRERLTDYNNMNIHSTRAVFSRRNMQR